MIQFFNNNNKGFTLVETLVAISIFSVSIIALMSILGSGISDTNYAKTKITATYLAQEGIEYIRNKRDTDILTGIDANSGWNQFKVDVDSITLSKTNINFYPTNSDFPNFTRVIQVTLIPSNPNEVKISSTVSWTQPSGTQSVTFTENLFNWTE